MSACLLNAGIRRVSPPPGKKQLFLLYFLLYEANTLTLRDFVSQISIYHILPLTQLTLFYFFFLIFVE